MRLDETSETVLARVCGVPGPKIPAKTRELAASVKQFSDRVTCGTPLSPEVCGLIAALTGAAAAPAPEPVPVPLPMLPVDAPPDPSLAPPPPADGAPEPPRRSLWEDVPDGTQVIVTQEDGSEVPGNLHSTFGKARLRVKIPGDEKDYRIFAIDKVRVARPEELSAPAPSPEASTDLI